MNWLPVFLAFGVIGALGTLCGVMLTAADKKFAVQSDERWQQVRQALGGANCGACGYSGCNAYAEAIVAGKARIYACPSANTEAIAAAMGMQLESPIPMKAYVRCQGNRGNTKERYIYDGYQSCVTAATMAGGPKMCCYACLGLGDCEKVCPFGAISIQNGVAVVDEFRCVGCGNCARYCPRHAIELKPAASKVYVKCNNGTLGRTTRAHCIKSCIGCGACAKKCPQQAIEIKNGHAVVDYSRCDDCLACLSVCPSWCIVTEQDWR
ncbi:MAG: RnfABCDGE type electron transport complex subunit B [Clostridia bacterium]|nr:RnfABCDGE type electron transport complex subunit B [Clostridia bacterium]